MCVYVRVGEICKYSYCSLFLQIQAFSVIFSKEFVALIASPMGNILTICIALYI